MPTPKIELAHKYYTAPQARKKLGLSRFQFDVRIERGVLPAPTYVDETAVRFFDEEWVKESRAILKRSNSAIKRYRKPTRKG